LESVVIPSAVKEIKDYAFYDCNKMTSLFIPANVSSIGKNAILLRCYSLNKIEVAADNQYYDSRNGCNAIIEKSTKKLLYGCQNTIIPNDVVEIAKNAFYGCSIMTSINIPSSVMVIGSSAFMECSGLESVSIPIGVKSIEWGAFSRCANLKSVVIPNSVTKIDDYAFGDCDQLTSVNVDIPNPLSISSDVFSNRINATLYVPAGCKAAYEAADYWKEFKEIIEEKQCATPTIAYENGELVFSCETEGATFVSEIKVADAKSEGVSRVKLSASYVVTVYAVADGYANSDVATATLTWSDGGLKAEGLTVKETKEKKGDVNGDGLVTAQDASLILQLVAGKIKELSARGRRQE
jgi:hypothetical protein